MFTASDPGGHIITEYGFEDTGSGHFVLNGVAQANNQEIDVTAAQLSQLSFQSIAGTADTLQVRAYDGSAWSNWTSFTVTAPPLLIQTDGSTSLVEIGNNYFLEGSGGSGPELKYNGAAVTAGEFGSWVPIGAVQTASGYDIAWKIPGANQYTAWTTDSNGNYLSNIFGAISGNSPALELLEPTFNQDLNGDGVIGLPTTVIQTDTNSFGSTSLTAVANEYFLYNASGSGPVLQ